jgi:hypothetical protein
MTMRNSSGIGSKINDRRRVTRHYEYKYIYNYVR